MERLYRPELCVLAPKRPGPGPKPQRAHAPRRAGLAVRAGAVHPARRHRRVLEDELAVFSLDSDRAVRLNRNRERRRRFGNAVVLVCRVVVVYRGGAAPHRFALEPP